MDLEHCRLPPFVPSLQEHSLRLLLTVIEKNTVSEIGLHAHSMVLIGATPGSVEYVQVPSTCLVLESDHSCYAAISLVRSRPWCSEDRQKRGMTLVKVNRDLPPAPMHAGRIYEVAPMKHRACKNKGEEITYA